MKKHLSTLVSAVTIVSILFGCSLNNVQESVMSLSDIQKLPVEVTQASFVYDTKNIYEAVGISDYVFVGDVVSYDGVKYMNTVITEDAQGKPMQVGSPYSCYSVRVTENIKGRLITDESISILKEGGVSQNQKALFLFEQDILPDVGKKYIFLGYAQPDGTIIVSGPNSNILISDGNDQVIKKYSKAYENEIVPVDRKRYQSHYETEQHGF